MSTNGAMTTLTRREPGFYDSQSSSIRVSPRSSKWLQQNITDTDAKLKAVITLIGEDASSFNRKAEMYFRKRPELTKLIEELYRAYRALAERYDYTTGELQWFHRAMAKAFPSQVLCEPTEELPSKSSAYPQNLQTPELTYLNNGFVDQNDVAKTESEIRNLRKALIAMGNEKEIIFHKYQQTMKKLSDIEEELNGAQRSSKELSEQASEAKTEVQRFKEAIAKVEVERDNAFFHEKELISRISTLERRSKEGAPRAEIRSKNLENEVFRLETEKNTNFIQYKLCLEKIADLERRTSLAENEAEILHKRAHRAETEVKKLVNDLDQLNEEKKSVALEYDHCLLNLSNLESELCCSEDEMRRITSELMIETEKLQNAEERYGTLEISNQSFKSEAMLSELKIVMKDEELSEKHKELEKLQALVQNEQLRILKVEAAILTFQNFHSQEENGSSVSEIREMIQILKDFDISQHILEEQEITPSVEDLQSAVLKLKEIKKTLEEELGLQKGLTDTLQKHIYVLEEDIKDLKERYQSLMEKIMSLGLNPECVRSSLKALKDENSKLREIYKENGEENEALSKKSDKLALISEKAAILSQLQTMTNCMEKLTEKNIVLENPLYVANIELESLKTKSENLEELCESLDDERSNLLDERSRSIVSLDNINRRLGSLESKFSESERKCMIMEKDREPTLARVEDLKASLGFEKRERLSLELSSEARLASLEKHLHFLQEETKWSKMEFEEEVGRVVNAHFEIFILHIFMQDLEMKNHSLTIECEKHVESSKLSEKLVLELERKNLEQQVEIELLISEIEKLSADIFRVFKALEFVPGKKLDGEIGNELTCVRHIIENIEDIRSTLMSYEDDRHKLFVENSILLIMLGQLRLERTEIIRENKIVNEDLESITEELTMVRNGNHELQEINEQLKSEIKEEKENTETLKAEVEKSYVQQKRIKKDYLILKEELDEALGENRSLMKKFVDLKQKQSMVEEDNDSILVEMLTLDTHHTVFKNFRNEKDMESSSISKDMQNLIVVHGDLEKEVGSLREKMETKERENLSHRYSLKELEKELHEVEDLNNQLRKGISDEMKIICQKEMEICLVEEKLKATDDLNLELCKTLKELTRKHQETELVKENAEKENFELSQENKNQCEEIILLREVNGNLSLEIDEKKNEFENLNNQFRNESSAKSVMLCQKDIESSLSEEELKSKHEETILLKERLEKTIIELTEENENQNTEIHLLHSIIRDLNSELKEMKKESEVWEDEASTSYFDIQISKAYEVVLENKICDLCGVCETLGNERASKTVEMEKMKERVDSLENEIGSFKAQLSSYAPAIYTIKENMALLEHKVLGQAEIKVDHNNETKDEKEPEKQVEKHISAIPNRLQELLDLQTRIKSLEMVITEKKQRVETHKSTSSEIQPVVEQENEPKEEMDPKRELVDTLKFQKTKAELILNFQDAKQRRKRISSSLRGADKIEVPTEMHEPGFGNNERKTLEIDSNAEQLESLQKTMHGLKIKTDRNKKRKMKTVDLETMKRQLTEVEEALVHMAEVNGPVKISPNENQFDSHMKALAKREPEKTERLHLEVQMIQNMLLQLENGEKPRPKTQLLKRTSVVVAKCFFHIWRRSGQRKRKGLFRCCIPSTNGHVGGNR